MSEQCKVTYYPNNSIDGVIVELGNATSINEAIALVNSHAQERAYEFVGRPMVQGFDAEGLITLSTGIQTIIFSVFKGSKPYREYRRTEIDNDRSAHWHGYKIEVTNE